MSTIKINRDFLDYGIKSNLMFEMLQRGITDENSLNMLVDYEFNDNQRITYLLENTEAIKNAAKSTLNFTKRMGARAAANKEYWAKFGIRRAAQAGILASSASTYGLTMGARSFGVPFATDGAGMSQLIGNLLKSAGVENPGLGTIITSSIVFSVILGKIINKLYKKYISKCKEFSEDELKYLNCQKAAANYALREVETKYKGICSKSDDRVKCKENAALRIGEFKRRTDMIQKQIDRVKEKQKQQILKNKARASS